MTPRLDCMRGNGRLDVLTILERTLAELSSLLLELLDGTLIDTTALVDQVASGGGLAGIDVADNCKNESGTSHRWGAIGEKRWSQETVSKLTDDVNVGLVLSHFDVDLRHRS